MNRPERLASIWDDLLATHETPAPADSSDGPALAQPLAAPYPLSDFPVRRPRALDDLDSATRTRDRAPAPASASARPEPRSLFGEILDFMLAPLLLLWPLTIVLTLVVARSLADAPYDEALRERAQLLGQQVRFLDVPGGVAVSVSPFTHGLLASAGSEPLRYQVVDPRGEFVFGERDLPQPSLYDFPEPGHVKLRTVAAADSDLRVAYLHLPVRGREDASRPVLVQVAEGMEGRNELANRIIKGVIFPQFVILPLAAALVWFGLSRGLRPLAGLRARIRARPADDYSPIDPQSAPHEIAPLVEAFNEMLGQLEHNMASQRRFIADAAHQIKTPLAGIRMQAELALREEDPIERRRSLLQLARSTERASHLINQLLALARAESAGERAPLATLDLAVLAREVLAEITPLALDARLDLSFEAPPQPAYVAANKVLLGELLHNLVINAIRYTPSPGRIEVRVREAVGIVILEVEDDGPGIPPTERERVFERFYRLSDRPPAADGTVPGSGLGLAIVREIARRHGASIRIEDGAAWPSARGVGRGARFVVRFAGSIVGPTGGRNGTGSDRAGGVAPDGSTGAAHL